MKWSYAGPIAGMRCTNVHEGAEAQAAAWADNFLCVPEAAPVRFHWSSAGPIAGLPCVRWFEHSDTSATWLDNWMCMESFGVPFGELSLDPVVMTPPTEEEAEPPVTQPPVTTTPPSTPPTTTPPEEVTGMHLQSVGCSMTPGLLPLLAAVFLLRRRRA